MRNKRAAGAALSSAGATAITLSALGMPAVQLAGGVASNPLPVPPEHMRQAVIHPAEHTVRRTTMTAYVTVRPGDTLWGIAQRLFHKGSLWPRLYAANEKTVGSNPNFITAGEKLRPVLAARGAFGGSAPVIVPARDVASTAVPEHQAGAAAVAAPSTSISGTLSCSGLEQLWEVAGGSPALAETMAAIAMAESSGQEFATNHDSNGTTDEGYWQINTSNGDATYDPLGNARAAVYIEGQQGLGAWVTYAEGLYVGRC